MEGSERRDGEWKGVRGRGGGVGGREQRQWEEEGISDI